MLAVGKVMESIAIATLLGASLLNAGFVNDVSAQESVAVVIADDAIAILKARCIDCHSGDEPEGDVSFDRLNELSNESKIALLKRAQDQVFFKLMPPLGSIPRLMA